MSEFERSIKDWCRIIDLDDYRVLLMVEEIPDEGPTMTITSQLEGVRIRLGLGFENIEDAFKAMDESTPEQLQSTINGVKEQMVGPDVD
jgi:hypothetical protein